MTDILLGALVVFSFFCAIMLEVIAQNTREMNSHLSTLNAILKMVTRRIGPGE